MKGERLRTAVMNMQPPDDAHEIWKHGFLVACQAVVALIDAPDMPNISGDEGGSENA